MGVLAPAQKLKFEPEKIWGFAPLDQLDLDYHESWLFKMIPPNSLPAPCNWLATNVVCYIQAQGTPR